MSPAERRNLLISMLFGGRTLNKMSTKLSQSVKGLQTQIGELTVRRLTASRDLLTDEALGTLQAEMTRQQELVKQLETALLNHTVWNRYRAILSVIPASVDLADWAVRVQRYENQHRRTFMNLSARIQSKYETALRNREELRKRYQTQQADLKIIPDLEKKIAEMPLIRERIKKGNQYRDNHLAEISKTQQILAVKVEGDNYPTCGRAIGAQTTGM